MMRTDVEQASSPEKIPLTADTPPTPGSPRFANLRPLLHHTPGKIRGHKSPQAQAGGL